MNCVSCGRPIALPTPDPFRCTVCRPLIVRAETAEKAETIMKELLEQERQSGATLARSLSEADETCDALRAELETERAACEMVRAELRGTSQRLADVNVKDSVKTREINILTKENRTLVADFTTLTQEIAQVVREFDEVVDGAIGNVPTEHLVIMTSQLRAALSRSLYSTEHTQPSDAVGAALVGAEPPADQLNVDTMSAEISKASLGPAVAPAVEGARPPAEDLVAIRAAWQVAVDRNLAQLQQIEGLQHENARLQARLANEGNG